MLYFLRMYKLHTAYASLKELLCNLKVPKSEVKTFRAQNSQHCNFAAIANVGKMLWWSPLSSNFDFIFIK